MFKSKIVKWIILLVVLAGIVCAFVFTPLAGWLANAGGTILSPVQNLFTYATESVTGWFGYWGRVKQVDQQNQQLLARIDELEQQNRDFEQFKKENESLRSLLELKDDFEGITSTGAQVIAKDAGNWFQLFTVNKGTSSGIEKNYPVVNSKGLIGRTSEAGASWAKVTSLIDPGHSVSGVVARTGDMVQVDGDLTLMKSGLCKMTIITENSEVIIGDTIETSGIGGVYPKGIMIGTVIEFRNNESGTGSYAVIQPAVDFQRISEVLILKMPENNED